MVTETVTETTTYLDAVVEEPEKEEEGRDTLWTRAFTLLDKGIHVFVGFFFVLAALLSLAYGVGAFADGVATLLGRGVEGALKGNAGPTLIIDFISDLLLTLIIMEVLGTVVQYLRSGETSLKPFIFIGIVSATRGILAVGARLSVSATGTLTIEEFRDSMIELGVNAAVIIALGVTLHLLRHYLSDRDRNPRHVLIAEPKLQRAHRPRR